MEANWSNQTVWTGDNLPIMRGMNGGSVDLIYLDPPFNSKANYAAPIGSEAAGAAFRDTWTLADVDIAWLDLIEAKEPALNRVIAAAMTRSDKSYLIYMAARLLEMRRILKPTGSIYLHCDPTMSHYLKLVMDAVFGRRNFVNEIVWRIGWVSGFKTQKRGWIRNHEIIMYYVKSPDARDLFNKEYIPYPEDYVRRDGKRPVGKGIPIEDTWNCSEADRLDSIMIKSFSKPHFQSEMQHRPASGARAWPERRRRAGVEGFSGQGPGFHAEYGGCPFGSERNRASRRRQGPAAGGGAPVRAREGVARPKPGGRACGIPSPPSADGAKRLREAAPARKPPPASGSRAPCGGARSGCPGPASRGRP